MEHQLIHLQDFTVQQNNYKSICRTYVVEHDNFKFFTILEYHDKKVTTHVDEINDGIVFAFNKIFKTKSIRKETIEELFEKSIKDLNSYIHDLIHLSNIPINLNGLHAVIGILLDNDLFITQRGFVHGFFLFKGNESDYKLVDILKPAAIEPNEEIIFTDIINGHLECDQAILFSNQSIGNYLTEFNIKKILTLDGITSNAINAHLKEMTNNENFCGVIVKNIKIDSNTKQKPKSIQEKTSTATPNTSISRLENTRNKTQELLMPSLFPKIKDFLSHAIKKIQRKKISQESQSYKKQYQTNKRISFQIFLKKIRPLITLIANTIKTIYNKIKKIRPENTEKAIPPNTKFNIKNHLTKSKIQVLFILTLIILIVISGFVIRTQRIHASNKAMFNSITQKIDDNILKAESALIQKADERANLHIQEALTQITKINETLSKFITPEVNEKYDKKITELFNAVNHIRIIAEPEILIDLSNELTGNSINGFELFKDIAYIYTNNNPYLALVNIEDQKVTLVNTNEEISSLKDVTIFERDKNQPIILTEKQDLYAFTKEKLNKITIPLTDNGSIKDIKTFNTNFYTLNPESNQIIKYNKNGGSSFGQGTKWIKESDIDISIAQEMFIDGTIYILMKNGTVINFLNGNKTNFAIQNTIMPPMEETTQMKFSQKLQQFYILEANKKRILVFNKNGTFLYQYQIGTINRLDSIAYHDKTNTLLLLSENQIYRIKE